MNNLPDCQYEYGYEAPKAIVIEHCTDCNEEILDGDEYYLINSTTRLCDDCMGTYKCTAEVAHG
jgi:hypothetical protein